MLIQIRVGPNDHLNSIRKIFVHLRSYSLNLVHVSGFTHEALQCFIWKYNICHLRKCCLLCPIKMPMMSVNVFNLSSRANVNAFCIKTLWLIRHCYNAVLHFDIHYEGHNGVLRMSSRTHNHLPKNAPSTVSISMY